MGAICGKPLTEEFLLENEKNTFKVKNLRVKLTSEGNFSNCN